MYYPFLSLVLLGGIMRSIGSPAAPPLKKFISSWVIASVAKVSIVDLKVFMTFVQLGLILVLLIVQPFIPEHPKTLPGKMKKNVKKLYSFDYQIFIFLKK